ncbi:hypothetical protein BGY98DRAFT_1103723 [Russula aff. rugulosa BPL654]|nr:hypothetical protein BGY98DRAFT_1103723 [Russula aff. rugulosa BPL654]
MISSESLPTSLFNPQYEFVVPKRVGCLDDTIRKVLVNGLVIGFCVEPKVARNLLPEAFEHCVALKPGQGQGQARARLGLRRFDPLELAKDALEISKTFRFAERAARNSDGGPLDPADIKSIQYVVGRVEDRGKCGTPYHPVRPRLCGSGRPIVIDAGDELLRQGQLFVEDLRAQRIGELSVQLWAAVEQRDASRFCFVAGRIALFTGGSSLSTFLLTGLQKCNSRKGDRGCGIPVMREAIEEESVLARISEERERTLYEEFIAAGLEPDPSLPGSFTPSEELTPSTIPTELSELSDISEPSHSPRVTVAEPSSEEE